MLVKPKPPNPELLVENIPTALKELDRWGCWYFKEITKADGEVKWDKPPVLSTGEPDKWGAFNTACEIAKAKPLQYAGIGLCVTGLDNGLVAWDLDKVLSEDGTIHPRAESIVKRLGSYTEWSPSRTGLRIFTTGRYDADWVNRDAFGHKRGLEVYSGWGGRYLTMTGQHFDGAPMEIRPVAEDVLKAIADEFRVTKGPTLDGAPPEMPELLDDVAVPVNLPAKAREFLESGENGGDRSGTLLWVSRCLTEAGLNPQEVLSLLVANCHAMEVAMDHRRQDEERGMVYLWKHMVLKAAAKHKTKEAEVLEAFAEEGDETSKAAVRRLAALSKADYESVRTEEAKRLKWRASVLDDHVKNLRTRIAKAQHGEALDAKRKTEGQASVDYVTPLPHINEEGYPRNHLENLLEIMRRLGVVCRYNVISKAEELLIPGKAYSVDNAANASFAWLESECSLFDFPTSKLQSFLTSIADENLYNPVAAWVTSRPWDGVSRLEDLFSTLRVEAGNEKLRNTLVRRWMLSAIAVAFSPNGCQTRGTLVLQGDQSIGKTRWLRGLAPDELNLIKEGLLLNPNNKDSVTTAVSHWIVELGELDATFRKADIAALNAFLTNFTDKVRRPYARKDSEYVRRTVFAGSVNPEDFLHDLTGSTRFWVVPVLDVNYTHGIDLQQVWAEILTLWEAGEQHWLNAEEAKLLSNSNEQFEVMSPIQETVMQGLNWELDKKFWRWVTASALLKEMGIDTPTRAQATEAGAAIKKHFKPETKRINKARMLRLPYRHGVTPSDAEELGWN